MEEGGRQVPTVREIPSDAHEVEVAGDPVGRSRIPVEAKLALVPVPQPDRVEGGWVAGDMAELGEFPRIRRLVPQKIENRCRDRCIEFLAEVGHGVGGEHGDMEVGGAAQELGPLDGCRGVAEDQ